MPILIVTVGRSFIEPVQRTQYELKIQGELKCVWVKSIQQCYSKIIVVSHHES